MTSFTLIALVLTLITLGLLIWPLRKNRNSVSYARQAQNIHYAKERINELEEQLKNASITATDYEALKLEIESNLADDIDLENQTNPVESTIDTQKSNKILVILLCCLLPLGAAGFYSFVGTPEALTAKQEAPLETKPGIDKNIDEMLAILEKRLEEQPNDVKGWSILAKTYFQLRQYDDAKRSMLKLLELQGESAPLLTSLADVTGLANRNNYIGEPQQYLERALKLDPNNRQALWMLGLAATQNQDHQTALVHWNRLLPMLTDTPAQQSQLEELISQGQAKIGNGSLALTPSESKPKMADGNEEVASKVDNVASQKATTDAIQVSVSIAPAMLEKAEPTDLVFIFAKASQGPPAPLAVKRLTVADLPITISLSDSDAMIEQFKLSLFEDVIISARVAKSGNPIPQTGDLESSSVAVKNTTTEKVTLSISSEIK